MKRNFISLLIAGVLMVSAVNLCGISVFADASISIYIDDEYLATDVSPVIINDRVMVPMRVIFETLGASVKWSDGNNYYDGKGRISSSFAGNTINMVIDEPYIVIGTNSIPLDVAPCIIDDRTFVPVRAVAESLSGKVDWDSASNRVLITTPYPQKNDRTREITSGDLYNNKIMEFENKDGYIRAEITDDAVVISGHYKLISQINLFLDNESIVYQEIANFDSYDEWYKWYENDTDSDFELRMPLSLLDETSPTYKYNFPEPVYDISIMIDNCILKNNNQRFYETILYFDEEVNIVKHDNEYAFTRKYNTLVWEHNKNYNSKWVNPANYISSITDETLVNLSNEICAGAENDYDKLIKIHDWIVQNICYDYDAFKDKTKSAGNSALDVYNNKRGVCAGYSALTKALVNAQGIPCRTVHGYALGIGNPRSWSEELAQTSKTNHAWNRAYANNRWINMDNTWDSYSTYKNGEYHFSDEIDYAYFDITDWKLSINHKFIS